jgi:hypothetical protein
MLDAVCLHPRLKNLPISLQQRSYEATNFLQAPIMPEDAATRPVDEDDDARHRREEAERRAKRKVRL